MTIDEAKEAISEMKAQGSSEEEIAASFYLMFVDDKIDVKQFDALVNLLGYHLSDDFLAMGTEQQKTQGFGESEEKSEQVSDEEVELAKNDETNPFKNKQESEDKESEEKEDSEDSEEDKAMKLFGK